MANQDRSALACELGFQAIPGVKLPAGPNRLQRASVISQGSTREVDSTEAGRYTCESVVGRPEGCNLFYIYLCTQYT